MTRTEDYVVTDRGGIVENQHAVHAAVVDSSGKLLFAVGNPSRITLARSAAKPAQALAIFETGACDAFSFDTADVALMCASHSGEDIHIARSRSMLAKVGVAESNLRCGGHASLNQEVNRRWIKENYIPTAICNNCSGKHAGMLGGARALKADVAKYHLSDSPMQLKVRRVFEELCGLDEKDVAWGIDGCNLPAPAVPLRHLAKMYAGFANAADQSEAGGPSMPRRTQYQASIFRAMTQHPDLVGGEGRFCTKLMQAFDGALVGKVGADGCYGVGVRASERTRRLGAEGGLGIAVKIEDGSEEILYAVVVELLQQLDIGTGEMRRELEGFHRLRRLNTAGVVTGRVSLAFKARPC